MPRKYLTTLTADCLREKLSYDPLSGIFRRRCRLNGKIAGGTASRYVNVSVNGRSYLAHRLAWLYVNGAWPSKQIDHRDGNPKNNAFANLREATETENHQNNNCKGYRYRARYGSYCAQIVVNKRHIHLGSYKTCEEARAAYVAASTKYFGEFSGVGRGMK